MTKEEAAKIMAVKYILNYNTFNRSERFKKDLVEIRMKFFEDEEFLRLFNKYVRELKPLGEQPLWARKIMAERYSLNV